MIEGTLHKTMSGAVGDLTLRPSPVEIRSGDVFSVEVDGKMRITRMEHVGRSHYVEAPRAFWHGSMPAGKANKQRISPAQAALTLFCWQEVVDVSARINRLSTVYFATQLRRMIEQAE